MNWRWWAPMWGEISAILDAPELQRPEQEATLSGMAIHLDHVSFTYKAEDGEVLHDISLDIAPGTVTALVGSLRLRQEHHRQTDCRVLGRVRRQYHPGRGPI